MDLPVRHMTKASTTRLIHLRKEMILKEKQCGFSMKKLAQGDLGFNGAPRTASVTLSHHPILLPGGCVLICAMSLMATSQGWSGEQMRAWLCQDLIINRQEVLCP